MQYDRQDDFRDKQLQHKKSTDFIFGTRAVIEAVLAGKEIDRIFVRKNLESELFGELLSVIKGKDIPLQRVPVEKLNRITMKNHQGVIAFLSAVTYQKLEDILPTIFENGKIPFFILLDGITDVRNFGAIARTCECAGVDAIVIPMTNSAGINADAVKTSAGALLSLTVCREKSLREAIQFLKDSGVRVVAASEKASANYNEIDYSVPLAIVMGSEDTGVSVENLRICDDLASIPLIGKIASLNVSVAAGILIYEVLRQRSNLGL